MQPVHIHIDSWQVQGKLAAALRQAVFVREQGIPQDLDMDGRDPEAVHVIAYDHDHQVVGTGRLLPDGRIGRLAVRHDMRRCGVGAQLLQALVDYARARGDRTVTLAAQVYALSFYESQGFQFQDGEPFLAAGVAHIMMYRTLTTD